jgi:hypothetical protein
MVINAFTLQSGQQTSTASPAKAAGPQASPAPAPPGDVSPACVGAQAQGAATLKVTAGTAEIAPKRGTKKKVYGAPAGVWLDLLPAGAPLGAPALPACHIKVPGAIKAAQSRERTVSAKKLTACFQALAVADCTKPLQARATPVATRKFRGGGWSNAFAFTPNCKTCARADGGAGAGAGGERTEGQSLKDSLRARAAGMQRPPKLARRPARAPK